MSRRTPALRPPSPHHDYDAFPASDAEGCRAYRAHHTRFSGADVWRYSSWQTADNSGRFDLTPPGGTCYVAESVEVSTRERLAGQYLATGVISREAADAFAVSESTLPRGAYAEVTDAEAVNFGINSEMSSTADYDVTHAWADVFHSAGFRGVHYVARFSTSATPNAYGVFGDVVPINLDVTLVSNGVEACQLIGLTVLDPPMAADLTIHRT